MKTKLLTLALLAASSMATAFDTPIEDIRAVYPGMIVKRLIPDRDIFHVTKPDTTDTWANFLSDRKLIALRQSGETIYRLLSPTTFGDKLSSDIATLEQIANEGEVVWAFGNCNPNETAPWLTFTCFNLDFLPYEEATH